MGRIGANPKHIKVDVAIRRSINNYDDPRPYRIVFTDSSSRKLIGEIRMTGEEFALMLTSSEQMGVPAEFLSDEHYASVGKFSWHASVTIPRGFDGGGYQDDDERLLKVVSVWNDTDAWGDVAFFTGTRNNGLNLTVRGFADSLDDAVHAAEAAAVTMQDYAVTYNLRTLTGVSHHPSTETLRRDRELGLTDD